MLFCVIINGKSFALGLNSHNMLESCAYFKPNGSLPALEFIARKLSKASKPSLPT